MNLMFLRILLFLTVASSALAQAPDLTKKPEPPRSKPGYSSSRDTIIDLSPPKNDAEAHPDSEVPDDVHEMRPYNPHKAAKHIEVGDYYFKQENYRAALSRYEEALELKANDPLATFKVAQALEKMNQPDRAYGRYAEYVHLAPEGPNAGDARSAMERLRARLPRQLADAELIQANKAVEVGETHLESRNYSKAAARFREALALKPSHARATYRLAETLEKLGHFGEAYEGYQRYLELEPRGEFAEYARESAKRLAPQVTQKK
jgi:tetratricopeptide (TPR) repeat protein